MICLNCGKHVDDDVRVCPFCGNPIEPVEAQSSGAGAEDDPLPITISGRESAADWPERPARKEREPEYEPEPVRLPIFTPTFFLALVSAVLSLLCLLTLLSMRGTVAELKAAQKSGVDALSATVGTVNDRLDRLDATLANVQTEAYNQVASQSITLVKDLTPLVGPVNEGKYNRMFIVTAKGNLNVDTSFDWQRYNEATGGWVSIVFTGDATTNEQYGLRLENQYDAALSEYTTILWANGITKDAAGTYRCVITDAGGITKTSAEATVSITEAAE